MGRTRIRLCLLVAIALAIVAFVPALAHTAPPKPAEVKADAYEPDDTTATAKPFAAVTLHTFDGLGDEDFSYVDITATGTPIMAETRWKGGFAMPIPEIERLNPDGSTTQVGIGQPWGGFPLISEMLVRTAAPGRYFVHSSAGAVLPVGGGAYELRVAKKQIARVAGANRFETAVQVSRKMWPETEAPLDALISASGMSILASPKGCIVATGRNFADALAAGAWSAKDGLPEERMPILLTSPTELDPSTAAEIKRLAEARRSSTATFTVYLLGGPSAVSNGVKSAIENLGNDSWSRLVSRVERIGGANRFETAALIASKEASSLLGISDTVLITNGFAYADALSAGPVAARANGPVLGVAKATIPTATAAFLLNHPGITKAVVVGSGSVVDTAVVDALSNAPFSLEVTRVAGKNRYETSRLLAEWGVTHYGMFPVSEVLVRGDDYPDGLTAAGLTGFTRSPVLLTPGTALSSEVTTFFAKYPTITPSYMIGGPLAISPAVEAQFDALRPAAP